MGNLRKKRSKYEKKIVKENKKALRNELKAARNQVQGSKLNVLARDSSISDKQRSEMLSKASTYFINRKSYWDLAREGRNKAADYENKIRILDQRIDDLTEEINRAKRLLGEFEED